MKITEIEVGPVYWYETAQNWGNYLQPAYNRHPVVRVDGERYSVIDAFWTIRHCEARVDPKGRYLKIREVKEDGTGGDDHIQYVQSMYVRGEMTEVRRRYDARQAADRAHRDSTHRQAVEKAAEAGVLCDRLAALGVEGIEVRSTDGTGYRAGAPKVIVGFADTYKDNPVAALTAILDRLEADAADAKAYRDEAADSVRGSSYDADHADRLANGAYER